MDLKRMNALSRIFAITAVVVAFYNAYLLWAKDEFSQLLFWITIVLILLSSIIRQLIKRKS